MNCIQNDFGSSELHIKNKRNTAMWETPTASLCTWAEWGTKAALYVGDKGQSYESLAGISDIRKTCTFVPAEEQKVGEAN